MQDNILEMRDITKSFFGVKVLKIAQLTVKKGTGTYSTGRKWSRKILH